MYTGGPKSGLILNGQGTSHENYRSDHLSIANVRDIGAYQFPSGSAS